MLFPLIPNDKHPKWIVVLKILEIIGSHRSRKIASKLKIYDIDNFILAIEIIILSSLFERDISSVILEINQNLELQNILGIDSAISSQKIYKLMFRMRNTSLLPFKGACQPHAPRSIFLTSYPLRLRMSTIS